MPLDVSGIAKRGQLDAGNRVVLAGPTSVAETYCRRGAGVRTGRLTIDFAPAQIARQTKLGAALAILFDTAFAARVYEGKSVCISAAERGGSIIRMLDSLAWRL